MRSNIFIGASAVLLLAACNKNKAQFKEAVFDANSIHASLEDPEAIGIRFYNVKRQANDKDGTIMAIPIRSLQGEEFRGRSESDTPYKMSDRITDNTVMIRSLTRADAGRSCQYIRDSRGISYATELTREEIDRLLSTQGANAIRIVPETWMEDTEYPTMQFTAATISGGVVRDITGTEMIVASKPCPLQCGPPEMYVNR